MTTNDKVAVAIAIIQQNDTFLMQLRDDLPNILFPGHWGFFGGHLDPGETADQAIRRELDEEIGHIPEEIHLFERTEDERVIRYFYQAELRVPITALELNEGQDIGLCDIADIQRGYKYSSKLQEDRPLGSPHQQALLTFLRLNSNQPSTECIQ
ncbi:MAG: NUDIX domain-containing protein [Leptolyngbyaceae cyanobacterium MAG.088]|nr:NUDIX domain-containing protein [Leptolyngbyaceae cyanobacterium MAG.088]